MTFWQVVVGIAISIGVAAVIVAFVGLIAGCVLAITTDRWEE